MQLSACMCCMHAARAYILVKLQGSRVRVDAMHDILPATKFVHAAVQVVSYADLKKCIAGAFGDLQVASRAAAPGGFPMGMGSYPRGPPMHF